MSCLFDRLSNCSCLAVDVSINVGSECAREFAYDSIYLLDVKTGRIIVISIIIIIIIIIISLLRTTELC